MSFNMTNVTGLGSSLPYHLAQDNVSAQRFSISADTANNLGYGVGRIIWGAFDGLWKTWKKMSTPEPSVLEIAEQRNYMIYEGGLRECVKLLGPALAKLQTNPKDRGALKKVEQLAVHFARYLKPSDEGNLRELQSKILKPLEERVSTTAHLNIKNALTKWMPVFFQGNNPMNEKAQTELQLAQVRRSQVMEEFLGAKAKPLQENDFEMTDPAGTDNDYYYSCQLNDVRNVLSYLDARLSKLFTIFPGVSAQTKETTDAPTKTPTIFPTITPTRGTAFRVYVTSWNSAQGIGFFSAIDTYSNKVVANITVGNNPQGIAITPNSRYAYVANFLDSIVSVIDTYSNRVVANVTVGSYPFAIAITPDGQYAYVTNSIVNTISVINTYSNRVVANVTVGGFPRGIEITPNGLYAYVICYSSNTVAVIEMTNNTILTTINVGIQPVEIAIAPDGLYAYVTNSGNNTVSVISTTSNAVIAKVLASNPIGIAIIPNGLYAYIACHFPNSISVIETTNNTVLTKINVGSNPWGIAITPDGLYAYVINANNNTINVINTTSNAVIATITLDNALGYLNGVAIAQIPTPPTTGKDIGLIIGLSCGAGLIVALGAGGYLTYRWLKKEEEPHELRSLTHPLSTEQKMILI
jgi:YVTN family beta-propeller protein